ncbi:hypothetical protein TRAPUB_12318 [Trametes pubescens]|uniref:Uncharacterized protein n=1 Tax=Trametes pubescens TaxID=154538 RepID=A0A1M2VUF7_TRAPU|nr:hypothetical protein TRAPUB_12318 [Trametes pubescens]
MSAGNINSLLEIWAADLARYKASPPFRTQADLYRSIDDTPLGGVKWESFTVSYGGPRPDDDVPTWMTDKHSIFFRNPLEIVHGMLSNPDFKDEIDYAPLRVYGPDGKCRLQNFMSGEWAWRQANIISQKVSCTDTSFVPIILGSDKTTVSVATGQNEYWPLYCSIGNVHNNVRRAHRNAVEVVAFLAIPKTNKKHADDANFRKFRRQLFHTSLSRILSPLRPYMEDPEVVRCGDGHFRKVVYGIGPYIADYPEQALLACTVQGWCPVCANPKDDLDADGALQCTREHTKFLVCEFELGDLWHSYGVVGDVVPFTNDFPRADIHHLISPDILHQLIKGTFKDHLVTWVEQALKIEHAIDGLVSADIVRAIRAFLEFCYLVRRDVHMEDSITEVQEALNSFHQYRKIFLTLEVRQDFSLPRQHSLVHYVDKIWEFAAPNGLCSSITESKHIKAVKEPWRRSNRYEALEQMLMTNQPLGKLAAARVDFKERGMLDATLFKVEKKAPEHQYGRTVEQIADVFAIPSLQQLIRCFLYHQLHPAEGLSGASIPLDRCPPFDNKGLLSVYHSASATFYARSDPCGTGGMHREIIRATPKWRTGAARFDCVFVNRRNNAHGLLGMEVGRIRLFFRIHHEGRQYSCAVVHWFHRTGDEPDEDTGMWVVQPRFVGNPRKRSPLLSVIHLNTIVRAAHLIGVSIDKPVPDGLESRGALDHFPSFFVNKYIDHHAFELLHTSVSR